MSDSAPRHPPDASGDRIAVYGSLMSQEGMLVRLGAAPMLKLIGTAAIPGRMYDLGEFPGLVSGEGSVPGELFAILNLDVLSLLDDYEGYRSEAAELSPFVRKRVRLFQPDVEAWVYYYSGPVQDCPAVTGASWPEYKARRGG